MDESRTTVEQREHTGRQSGQYPADGPRLAAALTAALLEYQYYIEQGTGYSQRPGAGDNWRFLGRIEQLKS